MNQKRKKLHDMSVEEFMAFSSSCDENDSLQESTARVKSLKRKNEKKKLKTKNEMPTKNKSAKLDCTSLSLNKKNDKIGEHITDISLGKGEKRKQKIKNETSSQKRLKREKSNDIEERKSSEEIDVCGNDKIDDIEKSSKTAETAHETDSDFSDIDEKALQTAMGKLKEKDPEFYKFLEENDKGLLEFTAFSDDSDDKDSNESQQKELAGSDDDDLDDDANNDEETRNVNKKLIKHWLTKLQQKPDLETMKKIVFAFKSAVHEASGDKVESHDSYHVGGNIEFNAVVQLCMEYFVPSLHKLLKLPEPSASSSEYRFDPLKLRGWKKVCFVVKSYLGDIIRLLTVISEPATASALLKHILYLLPFYLAFVKMSRMLLKKLISFWCTGEEAVRVVAFLCIIRLVRSLPSEYLDYTLKQMYLAYVKNCKFTSPSTWPLINFMKRSLVELYSLNQSIAYQHAFTYIRQLSIHLRNAVTVRKKDAFQAVYNWQYVHCLLLWIHLLSTLHTSTILKPLIYPLTQVTIGTIKLIPTSKYFPLRFHLVRGLIQLSNETDTFIPILPLTFEVIEIVDFNKKHTVLSMKPLDFTCALKLSKSQLQENGFKDAVVENVYELLIEYLQTQANRIAFPELVLPTVIHIKSFIKKCKVSNYCRKLKQLLDKIQENADTISGRRKSVGFQLSDSDSVKQWERETKDQGTPLQKFYNSWKKLRNHPSEVSKSIEEITV